MTPEMSISKFNYHPSIRIN